ncbi:MAG: hypothetical protein WAN51_11680, partial [Alphaproteobacteria bacterium]
MVALLGSRRKGNRRGTPASHRGSKGRRKNLEKPDLNLCRADVQAFIEASKDYFGKEEALLRRIGFPEVNEHTVYHASLLNHATELMRVCNDGISLPHVKACYDKVVGFLIDDVVRGDSGIKAY